MGMFDRFIKTEERALENPNAPVSADDFLHIMGWGDFSSAAGVTVNVDNALGVPAVWSGRSLKGIFVTPPNLILAVGSRMPLEEPSRDVIRIEPR